MALTGTEILLTLTRRCSAALLLRGESDLAHRANDRNIERARRQG